MITSLETRSNGRKKNRNYSLAWRGSPERRETVLIESDGRENGSIIYIKNETLENPKDAQTLEKR